MSTETPNNPPAATPSPAPAAPASHGPEPHLFDRLSVLYKYRWASIAVFIAVVGWVMVDSYTAIPTYRATARILVVASTNRTDSVDRSLVEPGRLDRLVEVALPDSAAQQEILELVRRRAESKAERTLFGELDYRSLLPPMGGMSGAEISEVIRRALEQKVQEAGEGRDGGLVTTGDLLQQLDAYRRIREVVEKIRYGQYL